ncbi:ASCH domain-containing protein [Lactococcus lactis]|uniref:ASCH domain-containing protein n=1 Tax=Lactococcus lactis TaxID=1358 RepID=UPI00024D9057|nr:ASCH domain-containing protein [Lactococcus lactis]BAL51128.1 hypothetical protein lilo_1129 [Lactococcus lactis subsp. lactis IO-1]
MNYEDFIQEAGLNPENFREAFIFGNSIDNITEPELGDELAELVRTGKKSATTSALIEYDMYNEPIPTVDGKFDIVLNSKCEPVAILTNSKVYQTTFDKVTAEHALKEGEGDLSLSYWRQAHERFFKAHNVFKPDMPVICEEYELLYKRDK